MILIPTNIPGIMVDKKTKFIVNLNNNEKQIYENSINMLQETNELKNEINELKCLIKDLIEKTYGHKTS